MSVRQISAHEATVKTATVEVRTLTVNGKQVTLAVFRQLIEGDIIDVDGDAPRLRGQAWGSVNYHPDKCADASAHLHVVWQDGASLRRAYLRTTKSSPELAQRRSDASALFVLACALRVLEGEDVRVEQSGYGMSEQNRVIVGGDPEAPGSWWIRNVGSFAIETFKRLVEAREYLDGTRVPSSEYQPYWGAGGGVRYGAIGAKAWLDEHLARLRSEVTRPVWRRHVAEERSSRAVMALYRAASKQNDAFGDEYGRLIDELVAVDQLFIAV